MASMLPRERWIKGGQFMTCLLYEAKHDPVFQNEITKNTEMTQQILSSQRTLELLVLVESEYAVMASNPRVRLKTFKFHKHKVIAYCWSDRRNFYLRQTLLRTSHIGRKFISLPFQENLTNREFLGVHCCTFSCRILGMADTKCKPLHLNLNEGNNQMTARAVLYNWFPL